MLVKVSLFTYPRRVDANLIQRLARQNPANAFGMARSSDLLRQVYRDPAVGWHVARSFARASMTFPETVIGRDHWLFRAYMMCLNPSAYHDHDVGAAYHISQQATTSAKLKAMLVAGLGAPVTCSMGTRWGERS